MPGLRRTWWTEGAHGVRWARTRRWVERGHVTRPLVATKLYVPRVRRGLVARPRLVDRLGGDGGLPLVSAPAGFGKTTLLASWLAHAQDGRRVAWLSLDPSDDDP